MTNPAAATKCHRHEGEHGRDDVERERRVVAAAVAGAKVALAVLEASEGRVSVVFIVAHAHVLLALFPPAARHLAVVVHEAGGLAPDLKRSLLGGALTHVGRRHPNRERNHRRRETAAYQREDKGLSAFKEE